MLRASQYKHWADRGPVRINPDKLLTYIRGYIWWHRGVPPSYTEMMAAMHVTSKNSIHRALRKLEAEGRIHVLPNRARAMEVLERAPLKGVGDCHFFGVTRNAQGNVEIDESLVFDSSVGGESD
jgi:SOS-response transcriptional repressor LexA